MSKKRNYYLDFWKGLACFGVVYFHTYFPIYVGNHDVGNLFKAFFRFAIPLFFMVSGYYCYYADNKITAAKLPGKIKHIFMINVYASFLWFIFQMGIGLLGNEHGGIEGMKTIFASLFTTRSLINWIVFNEDPFVKILWFLSALLYVYIMMVLINRFNIYRFAYIAAVACIVVHYILGNVLVGLRIGINVMYYRNFLLMGFPLFMLGHYIRSKEGEILAKVSVKPIVVTLVIGYLLIIPEWFILDKTELGIGILITAVAIFLLGIRLPGRKEKSFMTYIGTELSLFIYIIHDAVKIAMDRIAELVITNGTAYMIYGYCRFIVCFSLSVVAGIVFYRLLSFWKRRQAKNDKSLPPL